MLFGASTKTATKTVKRSSASTTKKKVVKTAKTDTTKSTTNKKEAETKTSKTSTAKKTKKEFPASSGMMHAAGAAPEPKKDDETTIKKKKKTLTEKEIKAQKRNEVYSEFNKYGLISITSGAILNHSVNTINKLVAATNGDENNYKYYEEKSRNYLKPHFSLPAQWSQNRVTFGTPWYY
ncbi:hypothetical protein MHSWG343_04340 [Candidatus Mycoplasma haematohominis]|uniref:Uncharacterized protein n=1 Tax=Candidatus Mycoplasma haematohominis TaxID=1494318 RepID=A0A478FQP8_9MOLU|nr:hypothetical protein MHSWG343_04340 [Candidatus Mycoplasma haemohominis]